MRISRVSYLSFSIVFGFNAACGPSVIEDQTSTGVSGGAGGGPSCVASDEVCDGLDNDCDGDIDEDDPGGGVACETGALGLCGPGTILCKDGALVCQPAALPSVELCDTVADESCDGEGACDGTHLWSRRFPGEGVELVAGIAATAGGEVLVAGYLDKTIDFGLGKHIAPNGTNAFLAKLDADGNTLWSKAFVGFHNHYTAGLAVDAAGNALVTGWMAGTIDFGNGNIGSSYNDIFLGKLDPDGNALWSATFGGPTYPASIAVDAAGNALLCGSFTGDLDFGNGPLPHEYNTEVFIAKLDPDGHALWSKAFGGSLTDMAYGIAADGAGNVIVVGDFDSDSIDFGDGPLINAGGRDIWIAKFDPDGKLLWSQRFGDTAHFQRAVSVAADPEGNIVFMGDFNGAVDFGAGPLTANDDDDFLAKLDPDGHVLWAKPFGEQASGSAHGKRVSVDAAGNILLTGVFAGTVDFGAGPITSDPTHMSAFVAKLDASGKAIWSKSFGGESYQDQMQAVAVDGKGDVLVAATVSGLPDLGGGPLFSGWESDVVVAKLAP